MKIGVGRWGGVGEGGVCGGEREEGGGIKKNRERERERGEEEGRE